MTVRILQGDCRDVLATLPPDSVHCVVTSPPYFGLRDYGIPPSVWGGNPGCPHEWDTETVGTEIGKGNWAQGVNGRGEVQPGGVDAKREPIRAVAERGFCRHCGAWRGVFGLEPTIRLYVEHAVEVFRAVRRVLRPDGTLWLNIGDNYAGSGRGGNPTVESSTLQGGHGSQEASMISRRRSVDGDGIKPKDLCGVPWRLAFALQDDGWWLRQDIVWHKPNPMPESATDRCTKSHEYLFLCAKSARYFYDAEAIKEAADTDDIRRPYGSPGANALDPRGAQGQGKPRKIRGLPPRHTAYESSDRASLDEVGRGFSRNKRSVWTIATAPYPEAHFATFPPDLVEPCIKAGTSERGCCAKCGAPWVRILARRDTGRRQKMADGWDTGLGGHGTIHRAGREKGEAGVPVMATITTGWAPGCKCDAGVVPCTVLDAFGGSGTTGLVADRLQRDAVLIDRSGAYVAMAQRRIAADAPLFATMTIEERREAAE